MLRVWLRSHWLLITLSITIVAASVVALLLTIGRSEPEPSPPQPRTLGDKEKKERDQNPLPPVVAIQALYPDAAVEVVEKLVTIPLEIACTSMTGRTSTVSRSSPGVSYLELTFEPGVDVTATRQEVVRRLLALPVPLPQKVTPTVTPGRELQVEVFRYTLAYPKNALGQSIYQLNDLRALQDYTLAPAFEQVPGIQVVSAGGTVKRYEVHPDPERLKRFGATLRQLQAVLDFQFGEDLVNRWPVKDPLAQALGLKSPEQATAFLRSAEEKFLRNLRRIIVVATVDGELVRVDDLVAGGPLPNDSQSSRQGVVIGWQTRSQHVSVDRATDPKGKTWEHEDEVIQGTLLVPKGSDLDAIQGQILAQVKTLNEGQRLLPGVKVVPVPATAHPKRLFIYGNFPSHATLEKAVDFARRVRDWLQKNTPVGEMVAEVSGPTGSPLSLKFLVGPGPFHDWPRPFPEILDTLSEGLHKDLPGISWSCSDKNFDAGGFFPCGRGDGLVKLFGPDPEKLAELSDKVRLRLEALPGVLSVAEYGIGNHLDLEVLVDKEKCTRFGIQVADVAEVIALAKGTAVAKMVEGKKVFDVTLRWPLGNRQDAILKLPVESSFPLDKGGQLAPFVPRVCLRDLVTPVGKDGKAAPPGLWLRPRPVAVYREQGQRLVALKFQVRGNRVVEVLAEAQAATAALIQVPYRAEWSSR